MIVLDTDVLSAVMKPELEPQVAIWLGGQSTTDILITTPTICEILYGLEMLPQGKRRRALTDAFEKVFAGPLHRRALLLDENAARVTGHVMATHKKNGIEPSEIDCQIAGIALSHGAAVATRNTKHFKGLKLALINPWEC